MSFSFIKKVIRISLITFLRSYIKLALRTTKWQFEIHPQARALLTCKNKEPALVIFWHETLILSPRLWWWALPQNPNLTLYVLISKNNDGQLITEIVNPWRIWAVQGSANKNKQNKGGAEAFRKLLKLSKEGHLIAITPDGPRGPRHSLHPGLIKLALLSKTKIVPMGMYCQSLRLKTWDRLLIPFPFGKGKMVCHLPIEVTKENYNMIGSTIIQRLHQAYQQAQS